jgi:membrane peptidoglycan carboxypeptidase
VANNTKAEQAADAETLSRKLNELRMAVAAEHQQSKQQILAGYLNDAYFGTTPTGSRPRPRPTSAPPRRS